MTIRKVNDSKIIGENIKKFIEAKKITQKWVYENAGIGKTTFHNLLKGEILHYQKHVAELIDLFDIEDPDYFYYEDFVLPKSPEEIVENNSIKNLMAASYHGDIENPKFIESINLLEEIVEFIDYFKNIQEFSIPQEINEIHLVEKKDDLNSVDFSSLFKNIY